MGTFSAGKLGMGPKSLGSWGRVTLFKGQTWGTEEQEGSTQRESPSPPQVSLYGQSTVSFMEFCLEMSTPCLCHPNPVSLGERGVRLGYRKDEAWPQERDI